MGLGAPYSTASGSPAEVALVADDTLVVNLQFLASTSPDGTYVDMDDFFSAAQVQNDTYPGTLLQADADGEFAGALARYRSRPSSTTSSQSTPRGLPSPSPTTPTTSSRITPR